MRTVANAFKIAVISTILSVIITLYLFLLMNPRQKIEDNVVIGELQKVKAENDELRKQLDLYRNALQEEKKKRN